ncbi:tRNA (adenosine(37)-N6)-threonylcarbamoyltransferase complex ATPase subunit type 1 TsaE [Flavobacterium gelidilacus]|jgi:tRNA threonylcarbamoyladenosine biosynthesis protein TsaE|uniref:tRNA (adenosine(37)-N6)-threonylcarbamoyltransferase complex ATPase subunit type 1 TsaE n=1 Tax=Flavobacterium gelidilacus TaxID=206041 RepID=UPI0004133EF5|nr:tRNA (adenosine(37)-N6)-threonylcarbamoyltransferase complex ATPase subunit type 1 TsaE [Flavobacterium gelidilacus]|tara:strand:+ start:111931 stop:112344 length:414 start_codon:yes stop_codon:yes gene_type:complete
MEITFSLDEIQQVAQKILSTPGLKKVITFDALMGVGKTTLIKALVKELDVSDNSSSPTFSIVNEYRTTTLEPIYHFDLYRLNNEIEGYDMGLDEYFYSGNWCFIEWPEKTPNLIPIDHARIIMKEIENGKRQLILIN